jgi:multidrug resistance efflux pump
MEENHLAEKEAFERTEFRSEEVREILGSIPHWTIRSGSGYLFILIVFALLISWFIKYPDAINTQIILTTETPPVEIVSKSSGYLTLWVKDKQKVKKDQYIGYLSSPANVDAVLRVMNRIAIFKSDYYKTPGILKTYIPEPESELGELQEPYDLFTRKLDEYRFAMQQKSYQQRIGILNKQTGNYYLLNKQIAEQNSIMFDELQLKTSLNNIDSTLYARTITSKVEFQEKKSNYLAQQRVYKNALSNITLNDIRVNELQGRVRDLQLEEQKQNKELVTATEEAIKQLDGKLKEWEQLHLLKAPFEGHIALFKFWTDHQYIQVNDEILAVIPENENFLGRAKAKVAGSGKIKPGQKVNIKIDNYPAEEYGIVTGIIQSISLLPKENMYNVNIELPAGLLTSYKKKLEFKQEMTGQAEIITEDLRLSDRFFYQLKNTFNR